MGRRGKREGNDSEEGADVIEEEEEEEVEEKGGGDEDQEKEEDEKQEKEKEEEEGNDESEDDGEEDDDDDESEECEEEEEVGIALQLPKRSTRGLGYQRLIGEALEEDQAFWNHDTWEDEEEDADYNCSEGEEVYEDVIDSDFDRPEDDEDDEAGSGSDNSSSSSSSDGSGGERKRDGEERVKGAEKPRHRREKKRKKKRKKGVNRGEEEDDGTGEPKKKSRKQEFELMWKRRQAKREREERERRRRKKAKGGESKGTKSKKKHQKEGNEEEIGKEEGRKIENRAPDNSHHEEEENRVHEYVQMDKGDLTETSSQKEDVKEGLRGMKTRSLRVRRDRHVCRGRDSSSSNGSDVNNSSSKKRSHTKSSQKPTKSLQQKGAASSKKSGTMLKEVTLEEHLEEARRTEEKNMAALLAMEERDEARRLRHVFDIKKSMYAGDYDRYFSWASWLVVGDQNADEAETSPVHNVQENAIADSRTKQELQQPKDVQAPSTKAKEPSQAPDTEDQKHHQNPQQDQQQQQQNTTHREPSPATISPPAADAKLEKRDCQNDGNQHTIEATGALRQGGVVTTKIGAADIMSNKLSRSINEEPAATADAASESRGLAATTTQTAAVWKSSMENSDNHGGGLSSTVTSVSGVAAGVGVLRTEDNPSLSAASVWSNSERIERGGQQGYEEKKFPKQSRTLPEASSDLVSVSQQEQKQQEPYPIRQQRRVSEQQQQSVQPEAKPQHSMVPDSEEERERCSQEICVGQNTNGGVAQQLIVDDSLQQPRASSSAAAAENEAELRKNTENEDNEESPEESRDSDGYAMELRMFTDGKFPDMYTQCPASAAPVPHPRCVITGQRAKYIDPLTGAPYATLQAFKCLRESFQRVRMQQLLQVIQHMGDHLSTSQSAGRDENSTKCLSAEGGLDFTPAEGASPAAAATSGNSHACHPSDVAKELSSSFVTGSAGSLGGNTSVWRRATEAVPSQQQMRQRKAAAGGQTVLMKKNPHTNRAVSAMDPSLANDLSSKTATCNAAAICAERWTVYKEVERRRQRNGRNTASCVKRSSNTRSAKKL